MIDASKFAKPLSPNRNRRFYRFGLGTVEQIAAALRQMAADVESGEILIQSVQTGQAAAFDQFPLQAFYMEFTIAELQETLRQPPPRIMDLPNEP